MSQITYSPYNQTIGANAGTLVPSLGTAFRVSLNGYVGTVEDKAQLVQAHIEQYAGAAGNGWISGGSVTIGSGLAVNVAALTAMVGNIVGFDASQSVGGFSSNATANMYLRQDGTWTVGTVTPGTADNHGTALLWASVVTGSGTVSSIDPTARPWFQPTANLFRPQTWTAGGTVTNGRVVFANFTTGTVTLPAAAGAAQPVFIKKLSATGTVVVNAVSGSVEAAASVNLTTQYTSKRYISDQTNWWEV